MPPEVTVDKLVLRQAIDDLNAAYAACIDADRLEDWPAFFTDPCLYQVVPRENVDAGLPLALIRCDSRGMLADRVVAHREANIFGPHAYRHLIGRAHIVGEDGALVEARTNYAVYRTWLDSASYGETVLYSVGEYRDRIAVSAGTARLVERTVVVDTARIDSLLATPL
ncbi:MAG: aromatic-ring-hydroxylating dioxygenase subunit beta [Gammaproteobacteria bacterium]|nr:aromatic-ring-hydroxylating dioxygenase subunit beta [Gammaproteobacteria bacterium]MCP5199628.1 aromatic-ring-hydroxylating dioxygenase subunit beta [Gammaproteobacteria bacterium]